MTTRTTAALVAAALLGALVHNLGHVAAGLLLLWLLVLALPDEAPTCPDCGSGRLLPLPGEDAIACVDCGRTEDR